MGMTVARRALRTAFGALGIVFLLGGPPMALIRDWGALVVVLLPAAGVVMIVLSIMIARQTGPPE